MIFTDDDLKRLKEELDDPYWYPADLSPDIKALLTRLEAAENVCTIIDLIDPCKCCGESGGHHNECFVTAWRKAAGK